MLPYRLLALLFFMALNSITYSQTYLGLKGGINQSHSTFLFDLDPSLSTNRGDLFGFYFGLPLEIEVNELVNFIPELAFVSEGSVISVLIAEEERTYNNAILYAKIPLIAKLKLLKNKYYEFGVVGGIVPAYAVGVKSFYYNASDIRTSVNVPINFEQAGIRKFDMALSVGLNTEKVIAKGWKLIVDLRYHLGLLDIETHSNLTNTTENINLTIGLMTPISGRKNLVKI